MDYWHLHDAQRVIALQPALAFALTGVKDENFENPYPTFNLPTFNLPTSHPSSPSNELSQNLAGDHHTQDFRRSFADGKQALIAVDAFRADIRCCSRTRRAPE
jgi:hypothetical protein